jgi:hypothetical protein
MPNPVETSLKNIRTIKTLKEYVFTGEIMDVMTAGELATARWKGPLYGVIREVDGSRSPSRGRRGLARPSREPALGICSSGHGTQRFPLVNHPGGSKLGVTASRAIMAVGAMEYMEV